ncbi:c-type cytochrome biogenesis protein CcmI, partial [Staphylococcus aureus]
AVYRDQLAEIERERRDGLIEADQADTAALEVKRRMLAVERGGSVSLPTLSLAQRHMSVATVVGLVAIGSAILYANLGRPDVPAVSHEPTTLVL